MQDSLREGSERAYSRERRRGEGALDQCFEGEEVGPGRVDLPLVLRPGPDFGWSGVSDPPKPPPGRRPAHWVPVCRSGRLKGVKRGADEVHDVSLALDPATGTQDPGRSEHETGDPGEPWRDDQVQNFGLVLQ